MEIVQIGNFAKCVQYGQAENSAKKKNLWSQEIFEGSLFNKLAVLRVLLILFIDQ